MQIFQGRLVIANFEYCRQDLEISAGGIIPLARCRTRSWVVLRGGAMDEGGEDKNRMNAMVSRVVRYTHGILRPGTRRLVAGLDRM